MRKIIVFTLMIIAAAAFAQESGAPKEAAAKQKAAPARAKKLSRAELDKLLADPKTLLIDVRRPDEVSELGGFPVYLSIQAGDLAKHLAEIPKDRTIVTVSNHAARASRAADLLDDHGFHVVGAVGVEDYGKEGGAITKIPIPKPAAGKQ